MGEKQKEKKGGKKQKKIKEKSGERINDYLGDSVNVEDYKNKKVKKSKNKNKINKSEYLQNEYDDGYEMMEEKLKELKKKKVMETDEFDEFNEEMEGHFIQNMSNLKALDSIPSMKVSNGSKMLGLINEKQNKGLVVNINSYQKVYIDYEDIEDSDINRQKVVNDYKIGEYILYEVKGEEKGKLKGRISTGDKEE